MLSDFNADNISNDHSRLLREKNEQDRSAVLQFLETVNRPASDYCLKIIAGPSYAPADGAFAALLPLLQIVPKRLVSHTMERCGILAGFGEYSPRTFANAFKGAHTILARVSPEERTQNLITTITSINEANLFIYNRIPADGCGCFGVDCRAIAGNAAFSGYDYGLQS